MLTSEFNAMLRQWEDSQLDRYLDDLDDEEEIPEECRECSQRGPKCFQCGFGYGG
jgi:hypothetical protein